jgi:O-antigen ligase
MTKHTDPRRDTAPRGSSGALWFGLVLLLVGGYLAFRVLDPILAAALVIVAATVLGMAALARNWDQHPGFEEREQLRAEKRKIKFAQNQGARDKDRARWAAHQARQRQKSEQQAAEGTPSPE